MTQPSRFHGQLFPAEARTELLEKFLSAAERGDGCWGWTGTMSHYGYPLIYHRGFTYFARRVSYGLFVCPAPPHPLILHEGTDRICTNPSHLYDGTHKNQTANTVLTGRARGRHTVLSAEKVMDIVHLYKTGLFADEIAKLLGVHRTTVVNILAGRRHRHTTNIGGQG